MPINKIWLGIPLAVILLVFLFWPKQDQELVFQEGIDQIEKGQVTTANEERVDTKGHQIVVDVKGAVHKPGVYEMNQGQRVVDVIKLAGGMTEDADETSVNLAMLLSDEMVIHVLAKEQSNSHDLQSNTTSTPKVRINVASVDELTQIPGIGEAKAMAIIQYREENGYFKTEEDLLNISGIGEKTLERIKEFIMLP